ncbi:hypothetical protein CIK05_04985 [Bdellovibrio sp. qaytius]|nr:hypothetical protein CIK05_04985 [Bdellovibrio sp. qaytius]
MIKHKLFREYFLLASAILILTIFLGFFTSRFVAEAFKPERTERQMLPPLFLAKTIDHLAYPTKLEAIRGMESFHDRQFVRPALVLINQDRQILYAENEVLPENLPSAEILLSLVNEYDFKFYGEKQEVNRPPPMPGGPGLGGPGGPPPGGPGGGSQMPRQKSVVKLRDSQNDSQKYYLVIIPPVMKEPEGMAKIMPILGFGSLVLSLLIGVGLTLFVIYLSVRKKVQNADFVISELHKGNLKARFQVDRNDEFGQAMMRFNQMADEIEHLVNHLKNVEVSRRKLLQELAHDLRTPIASLKTLLETLETNDAKLDVKTKAELLLLSNKEVAYFARLVEDLLVLSQVDDPKYNSENSGVHISQLLQDEIYDLEFKNITKRVEFKSDFAEGLPLIDGDRNLIKRMLRNALENSVSFAQSKLWISILDISDTTFSIVISDDGVGFKPESLLEFGERRMTRKILEPDQNSRVSVGLGSVIMKKICEIHGGQLKAENRINEQGVIEGAKVTFTLPKSKTT